MEYFSASPKVLDTLKTAHIPKAQKKADALRRREEAKKRKAKELSEQEAQFNDWYSKQETVLASRDPTQVKTLLITESQLRDIEAGQREASVKLVKDCIKRHESLENLSFISAIRLGCALATFKQRFLNSTTIGQFWQESDLEMSVRQINKYIQLFDIARTYRGIALMETSMHEFFEYWPRLKTKFQRDPSTANMWKLKDGKRTALKFALYGKNPTTLSVVLKTYLSTSPLWSNDTTAAYNPQEEKEDEHNDDEDPLSSVRKMFARTTTTQPASTQPAATPLDSPRGSPMNISPGNASPVQDQGPLGVGYGAS